MVNCSCFDYAVPTDEGLEAYSNLAPAIDVDALVPCYEDDIYAEKGISFHFYNYGSCL